MLSTNCTYLSRTRLFLVDPLWPKSTATLNALYNLYMGSESPNVKPAAFILLPAIIGSYPVCHSFEIVPYVVHVGDELETDPERTCSLRSEFHSPHLAVGRTLPVLLRIVCTEHPLVSLSDSRSYGELVRQFDLCVVYRIVVHRIYGA